ncbi:hypothetical protein SmJEL517_g03441 [Synchytrium microbalum]|uniref:non-specific serine/threonine protein kinase n=1 Tax=Synchytrium microbalum TaxID=1806994 RepID=A0A507C2W6_9FUNG|nr:uncharacterized protein SmJEL517_g03441 [Synchytrium microbalum]TPX33708.1 hypothetical protein SmJEL517_g03441 [Synchytrium microbalum]
MSEPPSNTLLAVPTSYTTTKRQRRNSSQQQLGPYSISKTLGTGAFSKVKLGIHANTGSKVAVKIINKEQFKRMAEEAIKVDRKRAEVRPLHITEDMRTAPRSPVPNLDTNLLPEVKLMMKLDHPSITQLYSVYDTPEEMFLVMEYAEGRDLMAHVKAKGHLNECEARLLFRQLVSALDHCHLAGVIHRDLKMENILMDASNENVMLTDFGLGRMTSNIDDYLQTFCGTPAYAAIELINGKPYLGDKTDIWALGVILYVLVTGKLPFHGSTIAEVYGKINSLSYEVPPEFSPELRDLFRRIFTRRPKHRIDMEGLRWHPWTNRDNHEPPARVKPQAAAKPQQPGQENTVDTSVASVRHDNGVVIYTIREHEATHYEQSQARPAGPMSYQSDATSPYGSPNSPSIMPDSGSRRGSVTSSTRRNSLFNRTSRTTNGSTTQSTTSKQPPINRRRANTSDGRRNSLPLSFGQFSSGTSSVTSRKRNSVAVVTNGLLGSRRRSSDAPGNGRRRSGDAPDSPSSAKEVESFRVVIPAMMSDYNTAVNATSSKNLKQAPPTSEVEWFDRMTQVMKFDPITMEPLILDMSYKAVDTGTMNSRFNTDASKTSLSSAPSYQTLRTTAPQTPVMMRVAGSRTVSASSNVSSNQSVNMDSMKRKVHELASSNTTMGRLGSESLKRNGKPDFVSVGSMYSASTLASTLGRSPSKLTSLEPSCDEIQAFHLLHLPASDIRTVRFPFTASTTSSFEPAALFKEVHRALLILRGSQGSNVEVLFTRPSPQSYTLNCVARRCKDPSLSPEDAIVEFEIEVCRVWLMKLYGIKITRTSGRVEDFKYYKEIIVGSLRI